MDVPWNLDKFLIKNVEKLRFEPTTLSFVFRWLASVVVFGLKLNWCFIVQRLIGSVLVIESHVFSYRLFELSF